MSSGSPSREIHLCIKVPLESSSNFIIFSRIYESMIIKPKCIIPYFLTESNNVRELNKDTYFTVCNFVSCLHSIKCRIDTRQPNISPRLSSDNYFHDIVCLFLFVVDLYGELIQQRKTMIRTILPQS
jgi:hypothetical protein